MDAPETPADKAPTRPKDASTLPAGSPDAESHGASESDSFPSIPALPSQQEWTLEYGVPPALLLPVPDGLPAIDGYEVLAEIGRGGMGVVYKARRIGLNRVCALKMIRGEHAGSVGGIRFQQEAETVARLRHPHIVLVHNIGDYRGHPYFELEYLEGGSLADTLDGKPWEADRAEAMVEAIATAVGEAHRLGIVHRDLKPANVLLTADGLPKVADFGLAKSLDSDDGLTVTGALMGTPEYMAPEQTVGGKVSPATDVHALGAILYELLVGIRPFRGATRELLLAQIESADPVPPGRLIAGTPRDLETICLKCLEKDPARRYTTATDLADDLHRYRSHESILARRATTKERTVNWVRRNRAVAMLLAAVVAAVVIGLAGTSAGLVVALCARDAAWNREQDALTAQAEATKQAGIAKTREADARAQTEMANTRLYDVRMNLVQHFWDDWSPTLFHETLDEQLPEHQGGVDRRGFEWFYWSRQRTLGHRTFRGHTGAVNGVAFSPDGRRIASASYDNTVKVWDAATGQEVLTLKGHTSTVTSVAFSSDGRRIASASGDFTVKVWDTATGQEVLTLKGHTSFVNGVAFSPDGRRIASASYDNTVKVWDAATGQEVLTLKRHINFVTSVAFSPDGRRIASASRDNTIKVWDATTGQEVLTLKGHTSTVYGLAFSPDGRRIASASEDNTIKVWDTATGQEDLTLKGHTNTVTSVAFSPDGRRIASASWDFTVKVWDAATGQEVLTLKRHINFVTSVAFSPDGRRIASASWDNTVKVWDAATGQEVLTLKGHTGLLNGVAFSPDGRRIASASGDSTVKLWDTATGQEALTLKGHAYGVNGLAFSPDGRRIASASGDFTVKVWDARPVEP